MSFTLDALHADEALRVREFPVAAEKVYLAHAAVSPLPACVVRALSNYLQQAAKGGQFEYLHAPAESQARALAAALIGAAPDEIAFVPSTSTGLSMVAAGLPWRAGDSVVIAQGDFPSNVYPWLRLQAQGVVVKSIPARDAAPIGLADVVAQLDTTTRLVALSSVHYATGARTDVDAIGRYLQSRGILLCVDAIQSLGALALSASYVDFMVADAHKWLLGPQGIGVLFVRRAHFAQLEPVLVGWKSARSERDFSPRALEFADSARRYEPGSLNALGLVGLHAALDMLQRLGSDAIAKQLATLRAHLIASLLTRGCEVLGDPSAMSSIVSFRRAGVDLQQLQRSLDARGIIVSLRHDPQGQACVRVAPHFYNTHDELNRLLAQL
jgi:cysteine desulfurase / selenocysteine lyase